MVIVAVEGLLAGSKPPAAVGVRIFKGEINDFGAAAPLSTKTLSLQGRTGDSASTPKLVELVGPLRPFLQNSYPHASLLLLRLPPWRDMVAEGSTQGLLNADRPFSYPP